MIYTKYLENQVTSTNLLVGLNSLHEQRNIIASSYYLAKIPS